MANRSASSGFTRSPLVQKHIEKVFVLGVVVGMSLFALGFVFFMLGMTMDATPPAPYFVNRTQRLITIILGAGGVVGGGGLIRWSARTVGW